jgi:F-type H+-transporting ATPase subunit gamma
MLGIREFNRKIVSLRNTRKITASMKMMSSVKMQRYARIKIASLHYWQGAQRALSRLASVDSEGALVAKTTAAPSPEMLVLLITSDRGMCGHYNSNIIRTALTFYKSSLEQGLQPHFVCIGARGRTALTRRQIPLVEPFAIAAGALDYESVSTAAQRCFEAFSNNTFEQVWVVYTRKVSSLMEEPCTEQLLPLPPPSTTEQDVAESPPHLEEDVQSLREQVTPLLLSARLHQIITESSLSEHAARVSAMDAATTNCDRMIDKYLQLRNRARQSAITTELSEIVTGKEALES